MYTIFINESVVYLAENPIKSDTIFNVEYDKISIENSIDKLENEQVVSICIYHNKLDELWNDFKSYFTIIEAAGGLVFNEKNETLWIYRHDKWDLPKGKVEKHENIEEAALREVEEECGVTNLELVCPIQKTYHVYNHKEKTVLKITHWYKMFTHSTQDLTPQLEEHITEVAWIDTVKVRKVLKNTYNNIKLLCKFALP